MSLLLASDDLPEATQTHVLQSLLHFLCNQITSNLSGDAASSSDVMASSPPPPSVPLLGSPQLPQRSSAGVGRAIGGGPGEGGGEEGRVDAAAARGAAAPPLATMQIHHALEAAARLSKGFSHDKLTRQRPELGAPVRSV